MGILDLVRRNRDEEDEDDEDIQEDGPDEDDEDEAADEDGDEDGGEGGGLFRRISGGARSRLGGITRVIRRGGDDEDEDDEDEDDALEGGGSAASIIGALRDSAAAPPTTGPAPVADETTESDEGGDSLLDRISLSPASAGGDSADPEDGSPDDPTDEVALEGERKMDPILMDLLQFQEEVSAHNLARDLQELLSDLQEISPGVSD